MGLPAVTSTCVRACVCVVTHSPTRTLRIEGGVLALKREWGSCPKMRKGRKAFRAECRTWAGDEGLSPPRSAACWRFSRRRGALPTRRQPGRREYSKPLLDLQFFPVAWTEAEHLVHTSPGARASTASQALKTWRLLYSLNQRWRQDRVQEEPTQNVF